MTKYTVSGVKISHEGQRVEVTMGDATVTIYQHAGVSWDALCVSVNGNAKEIDIRQNGHIINE